MVAHQNLAVLQLGQWHFDQFEVGRGGFALGAVVENDAVVDGHGGFLFDQW
jgi:hypothetical protein